MKITLETDKEKFTFETHDDLNLAELHTIWVRCLYALSWTDENIKEFYPEDEFGDCWGN